MSDLESKKFNEIVVILDDKTWIWDLVQKSLHDLKSEFVRIPSSTSFQSSWTRFKNAPRFIIYWENKLRSSGAIVEELNEIDKEFRAPERCIVLTSNPTNEDIVYLSELGLTKVIRLRQRDKDIESAINDIKNLIKTPILSKDLERMWLDSLKIADEFFFKWRLLKLTEEDRTNLYGQLSEKVNILKVNTKDRNARILDLEATLAALEKNNPEAIKLWDDAERKNAGYLRALTNRAEFYHLTGDPQRAYAQLQNLQVRNTLNTKRLVQLGDICVDLGDDLKAEHYYQSALSKDPYCNGALNGLAEIRFRQGNLEESRSYLSRSTQGYKLAVLFNNRGIDMVKQGKYREALELYTKAQYVLPQQEKGPLLFYNIGLCYSRWGKFTEAKEFLKLALVKDPTYIKAQKLMQFLIQEEAKVANAS